MIEFNPEKFRTVNMPNCCGNCGYNEWDEDGCHCHNRDNYLLADGEIFEIDRSLPDHIELSEYVEGDDINWNNVCDNHIAKEGSAYQAYLIWKKADIELEKGK
jgi:hypothetical protein